MRQRTLAMADDVRQNPAHERGECVMLTTAGRDPAWTNRVMAELWANATRLNLQPLCWRLGFYGLRDVIRARDPDFQAKDYRTVRIPTVWGCEIQVVSLWDTTELVAVEEKPDGTRVMTTLVPKDVE